ncbi:MAG: hypothetical protein H7Y22_19755, partial [Gemmatimonadaceae bacterium]|nr:hypothetical protein [Gloeobacterales cyanobacterium ES-bin-141]
MSSLDRRPAQQESDDQVWSAEPTSVVPRADLGETSRPPRQWLALGLSLVVISGGAFWLHNRQPAAPPAPTAALPAPVVTVTTA